MSLHKKIVNFFKVEAKTKIILNRQSNIMNRFRAYSVFINGEQVGLIKSGNTLEFLVKPGANSVECKIDWRGSKAFPLNLKEGEISYLRVRNGMRFFYLLIVIIAIVLFLAFYYKESPERPTWLTSINFEVFVLTILYALYYLTIGRKNYLKIEKDTKNIFAKQV